MQSENREAGTWEHCSCAAVRRASRQLSQLYDDVLAPSGLRTTQFSLLSQIALKGDPSLKALAEMLVMDLSALGHTLKPLTRDQLIELVPDGEDRRVKRVRLTPLGKEKRAEAEILWRKAQSQFDALVGEEQSAALREAMAAISSPDFARAFGAGSDGA